MLSGSVEYSLVLFGLCAIGRSVFALIQITIFDAATVVSRKDTLKNTESPTKRNDTYTQMIITKFKHNNQ